MVYCVYSFVTATLSFMITTYYYGMTECTLPPEPFARCQSYKVECDIIPKTNFDFNCSAAIPAFGDNMNCVELHPPPDICKQLTVVSTTPGVTAVANVGLANVMVRANSQIAFQVG